MTPGIATALSHLARRRAIFSCLGDTSRPAADVTAASPPTRFVTQISFKIVRSRAPQWLAKLKALAARLLLPAVWCSQEKQSKQGLLLVVFGQEGRAKAK